MDFWGQVWKRVWEMAFFGLKLGLDLEMRAAHPHLKFQGIPPPPGSTVYHWRYAMFNINVQCYQNISQVLLTSAFILWPPCTCGFGIREKKEYGLRFFGVFLCGFAVFRPPLCPPLTCEYLRNIKNLNKISRDITIYLEWLMYKEKSKSWLLDYSPHCRSWWDVIWHIPLTPNSKAVVWLQRPGSNHSNCRLYIIHQKLFFPNIFNTFYINMHVMYVPKGLLEN